MVFNSISFFIFFTLFFFIYWIIARKASLKITNLFILLSSYLFYGWWDWRFLGLLLFSSTIDYFVALNIEKADEPKKRKALLCISIFSNIGLLAFFKYYNFFVDSFVTLLDTFSIPVDTTTLSIILPVGISFYTFQALSYTIEVYRKNLRASNDIIAFLAFVSFFPQLVAGPIERARELLPQFYEKKQFSYANCISGLRLMLWGFFQKIVIADNLAMLVEKVYNAPSSHSGLSVLLASICFAFQIYCDFAGYSNIAIGTAKMLGFQLSTNFKTPYFSTSFTSFWRRWHISLSTWFRDYVYIPLGGNKGSQLKTDTNLLITFVLSGLWHGAAFTFILWGTLHGLLLILNKRFPVKLPSFISAIFVFMVVTLLWMPFRAKNMEHLGLLAERILYSFNIGDAPAVAMLAVFSFSKWKVLMLAFIGFLLIEYKMKLQDFNQTLLSIKRPLRISLYYVLLFLILTLGNFNVKPYFIYFQF